MYGRSTCEGNKTNKKAECIGGEEKRELNDMIWAHIRTTETTISSQKFITGSLLDVIKLKTC
jgi:hypothetical protein